ncbi:hypothetical protein GCM10009122_58260 [Fulvivirga kasyanovii]|uniref:Uncharacterized protein n=1 Tax=Fulvivirga kasyanovii TaxID=396812 RepID=A0ABW9RUT8_9BACT|nr:MULTISPECIES: hypothetical protein [Fulvivirga]MTI26760.1 hypothetical protein [Fulvivirga kasyanovii]UII29771.1 hypothetical protein LVD17_15840 [Fulvivirga ulvae]
MNKEQLKANLLSLERKINLLVGEHKTLKLEVSQLKSENDELRSIVKSKEEQISSFQNKIKISKIVNEIDTGEGNTSELKRKIDDYIKEIDKCIAHLSK